MSILPRFRVIFPFLIQIHQCKTNRFIGVNSQHAFISVHVYYADALFLLNVDNKQTFLMKLMLNLIPTILF